MTLEKKTASANSWVLKSDEVQDWAYWDNAFTNEECDALIKYCKETYSISSGKIGNSAETISNIRESKVAFIPPDDFTSSYYNKLTSYVISLNERFFKFDLFSFSENLQFTEYEAPTGKYNAHVDRGYGIAPRKLSIVLQLTDPEEYDGGNLELCYNENPIVLPKTRGTLIVFPSFQFHRVTPVTRGIRNSLVGWVTGPQFK